MTLSIKFIGWFYALTSIIVLGIGSAIFFTLQRNGKLAPNYLQERAGQDVGLMVIWIIGLVAGMGVVFGFSWSRWLLEFFCWTFMVLLLLSSASRLYHLKKNVPDMAPAAWINSILGVTAFVGPLVAISVVTIISLRGEEAAQVLVK